MANNNGSALFRAILSAAAIVQVTIMLVALPISLASALSTLLDANLRIRIPIDYYQRTVYPILRSVPGASELPTWTFDVFISLIVLGAFAWIYWSRIARESARQLRLAEQDNHELEVKLSQIPTPTKPIVTAAPVSSALVDTAATVGAGGIMVGGLVGPAAVGTTLAIPIFGWIVGAIALGYGVALLAEQDRKKREAEAAEHAKRERDRLVQEQQQHVERQRAELTALIQQRNADAKAAVAKFRTSQQLRLAMAGALAAGFVGLNIVL